MYDRGTASDREGKHSCEKKERVCKREGKNMQREGKSTCKKLHEKESTRKGKHVRKGKSMCKKEGDLNKEGKVHDRIRT